jgi:hypothetical protein
MNRLPEKTNPPGNHLIRLDERQSRSRCFDGIASHKGGFIPSGGRLTEPCIFELFVMLNFFHLHHEFKFLPGSREFKSLDMGV